MTKLKTYVITVSRTFPKTHAKAGEPTFFAEKIDSIKCDLPFPAYDPKIHTIRANYPFWEKRIDAILEGKAVLSIRYWSGKPYNSKQTELCQLDKDSGIGIQEVYFHLKDFKNVFVNFNTVVGTDHLSENDGLSLIDFKEWFKGYDLSKPMAIIHFTKFRY